MALFKFLSALAAFVGSVKAAPGAALTKAKAESLADTYLKAMSETLASGSMRKFADAHFAEDIVYDWSGPQQGKGKDALVKEFGATWGAMVSNFNPGKPIVVLDSVASKIIATFS